MNLVVSHWSANLPALAGYAVVAAVQLRGMRGLAADAGRRGAAMAPDCFRQAVIFHAGLLLAVLALVSPVGYWSQQFIWVRSAQDLLLAVVAPGLIALGAPWLALRRGLGRRSVDSPSPGATTGAGRDRPELPGPSDSLGWAAAPLAATVAFNAVWCGWHLPAGYDAALRDPLVYGAEAITYLGSGTLFWLQLIGSRPWRPQLAPLRRLALLTATSAISTVLAMVLVFGSELLYPAYLGSEHQAFSVVADQQVGGAMLWVLMLPPYAIAAVALLIGWLNDEESQALATGLDRLLKPARPAWPSRPGLR
ncbi:MAG TPA: cytochrome c oxidase assembly protein [Streptosporangiaceae bacterium]